MGALMFAFQVALSGIPNVHITAVLIILTAVFFGWRRMYPIAVFIMLEGFFWGFAMWWFCYWYLWPILGIAAVLMRKNDSALVWAIVAAVHGLIFGALCSIPYLFIGGWTMALSYWVSGIPFDLIHCGGNFVMTLVLYKPLKKGMEYALHGKTKKRRRKRSRRRKISALITERDICYSFSFSPQNWASSFDQPWSSAQ